MSHWGLLRTIAVGCGVLVGLLSANQAVAALSLQTSFNVAGTYTDNLQTRNRDAEEDFGTLFGPTVTLLLENPDIVIGVTYIGRVSLFVNNSDANSYNQNANITLDLPFLTKRYRGLTVTIDESMNFTPQLDAFSLSESQDASSNSAGGTGEGTVGATGSGGAGGTKGVVTRRANAFLNRAGLTLGYALSPRLNPSLSYQNQYRHFFGNGFQDSLTHTGTFAVSYGVTEYTTIAPSYSYRQTEFLGKSTQSTSADRTISHSIQLRLTHAISSSLSATISGGMSFVKQEGATEEIPVAGGGTEEREIDNKFVRRPIVRANLSKTFQRASMSLSASQNIGSGGGLASQASETRIVTGQVTYALTPLMNASASAGWAHTESIDGNAFDTDTYRIQTGLGYTFTHWLSGNLSYSRIDQRSKGTVGTDVVVNSVFLGLTAVAPSWSLIR